MNAALVLQSEHTSYRGLDSRLEERVEKDVRNLCGLFVNVIDKKVYVLYQTAKEFLIPKDDPDSRMNQIQHIWKACLYPSVSHSIIFQICIRYLLFAEFEIHPLGPDGDLSAYLREHIFLDYSAANWASHFRASDVRDNAAIEPLLRNCDPGSGSCRTWFRIYWERAQMGILENFITLMVISYFGIERIVKHLLKNADVDLNTVDGTYQRSVFSWASEHGFGEVVKLLIKVAKIRWKGTGKLPFSKGSKVDARDKYGRTSYHMLLGMAIHPSPSSWSRQKPAPPPEDKIGGTPISYALCTGQEAVVSLLMNGTDTDSAEEIRQRLLKSAAREEYEAVVERLLDNGADIETKIAIVRHRSPGPSRTNPKLW